MRIREIRESKNLSQLKLAHMTGLTQAFVCELETGRKNPSISSLVKVAKALDCSIDDLLSDEDREELALSQ